MIVLLILGYLAPLVFLVAVLARVRHFANTPVHLRWELYPVPHESPDRVHYGGSYMEDMDFWEKKHQSSKLNELKEMLEEMVFIKALFQNNLKLWSVSFPFHFGMYCLAAFIGFLVVGGVVGAIGLADGGVLATVRSIVVPIPGFFGFALALFGATGLFLRRVLDPDLTDFTGPLDYLNLLSFVGLFGLGLVTMVVDPSASGLLAYFEGLFTLSVPTELPVLTQVLVAVSTVMIMYVPVTHMSHFVAKYYTYHDVRWADEAFEPGSKTDKALQQQLGYPVSWAAEHIKADGKKSWAELAMINPAKDEEAAR